MRRELGGPRSPASDLGIPVLPISSGRGMAPQSSHPNLLNSTLSWGGGGTVWTKSQGLMALPWLGQGLSEPCMTKRVVCSPPGSQPRALGHTMEESNLGSLGETWLFPHDVGSGRNTAPGFPWLPHSS